MNLPRAALLTRTLILLAVVGIGFGIGWLLPSSSGPDTSQAPVKEFKEALARVERVEPVESQLVAEAGALPSAPARTEEPDLARLLREIEAKRQRVLPTRSIVAGFRGAMIEADGTVSEEAAELFQLTPAEVRAANQAIRRARDELMQLESERMELLPLSPTEVAVSIAAFPEEGEAVKRAFHDQLLLAMGGDAGELFWEMANRSTSRDSWSGFGEEAKELYFGMLPDESSTAHPESFPVMSMVFGIGPAGSFTTEEGRGASRAYKSYSRVYAMEYSTSSFESLAGRHGYLSAALEEFLSDPFASQPGAPR